jgi:hypothetical protein
MKCPAFVIGVACAFLTGCAETGEVKLFNGRDLAGWTVLKEEHFASAGKVYASDGALHLEAGRDMTGVTWTGRPPTDDYEIALQAMKVDGDDFFCGLTFPVGGEFATLIVGGFGGRVVGLSNVNGCAADQNETTKVMDFAKGRWYSIRLRVAGGYVEAWIDDEAVIELGRGDKKFSVWAQQEPARPLGINTWCTHGAEREIVLRRLRSTSLARGVSEAAR